MSAPITDRRLLPRNARVVAAALPQDLITTQTRVAGTRATVRVPVADLLRDPDGARDRQLLLGEEVCVYERRAGWAFVQAARDSYVGYLREDTLGAYTAATHCVSAAATHVYDAPDFKTREQLALSFGSQLTVVNDADARFVETSLGYVPRAHLRPLSAVEQDPVAVAERFLGTPYLWGGNSRFGIDCSGLVQAAYLSCGWACPGDSDQQERACGAAATRGYQRGDLLFWKGHVALVRDQATLIHANAYHMATAIEAVEAAITRIKMQGDGDVTSHIRPFALI